MTRRIEEQMATTQEKGEPTAWDIAWREGYAKALEATLGGGLMQTLKPHGEHYHNDRHDKGFCKCADYYFAKILNRCDWTTEVTFAYDMWVACNIHCEHGEWVGTSFGLCGGFAQSIQAAWVKMDKEHPPTEE